MVYFIKIKEFILCKVNYVIADYAGNVNEWMLHHKLLL